MLEQIENHGKHLHRAIETTPCNVHQVPAGSACWNMVKNVEGSEGFYAAICGKRIRKAGFVGKISASSMRLKAPARDDDPKSGPRRSFTKKTNAPRTSKRENSN